MPTARILLIEDEPDIASFLRRGLTYKGYAVDWAGRGEEGLILARERRPDLVILDLMLPDVDGVEVCRRIQQDGDLPVIMLTARDSVADKVAGLDAGADDYLTKPFAFDELLARVRAAFRRRQPAGDAVLRVADLAIRPAAREVTRGGRMIELTAREYDLLEFLARHAGQVVSKEQIFTRVWGYDWLDESDAIKVYIRYLRRKLNAEGEPDLIQIYRGVGYMLKGRAMTLSLRARFAISFAVAFFLTLALLFITLNISLRNILIKDLDDELDTHAQALVEQARSGGTALSPDQLVFALAANASERLTGAPVVTAVFDAEGRLVRASRFLPEEGREIRANDLTVLSGGEDWHRTIKSIQGRTVRMGLHPIQEDERLIGVVETAAPLGPVTAATDRLQTLLWIEGAVAAVIATVAGYLIARGGLKPLHSVSRLAADIEANDLTRRLHLGRGPLEVRRLAETFDAMLDRLEQSFAMQRSFALNVAHELRTPLTALRGNLDVLLLDPTLDGELRAEMERLAAETARMTRLTSNLLALAQAEVGRHAERRPVDLDVLCLEVYQQARGLYPGVRLRLGHEDQVTVLGDQDLLKQLILNLIENAMKYTPRGGTVTLSLYGDSGSARITVEDTGPGIRPEDLPRIFERFYRAPAGGGRVAGGAGIGLSVARWIATEHGGDIEVESVVGRGSAFTVRLPREAPARMPGTPATPAGDRAAVAGARTA